MNTTLDAIRTLALLEARVRLRRLSTLVTLLAVVALSWMMISDPANGQTLISVRGARVLYTSSALALGSAALATLLLALAGFYLLRGRVAEDLRSGTGSVIGASPNGGALFVVGRWCGGVLYLAALVGAFMATVLLCHAVRGDGPIEPLVYLQTYALVLGPMILFTASCATLFDAWAPLMGKKGDVLYFFVWVGQMALLPAVTEGHAPAVIPFDFTGTSAVITALGAHVDINDSLMLGIADFDRSKAALTLPTWMWTASIAGARCLTALLAVIPLLLALPLFHRFSPDRVKPGKARARRSPLADVALTLAASPTAIALLLAVQVPALALDTQALAPFTLVCVAYWGILVSDVATRDGDAALAGMGAAVPGGSAGRYWRQFLAGLVLGLMFTGVAMLHLAAADPLRAGALLSGVFALAAFASLSGRTSGTSRTFLALFLFGLYVSVNVSRGAWADIVGFHGNATVGSSLAWAGLGVLAVAGGHLWTRRAG